MVDQAALDLYLYGILTKRPASCEITSIFEKREKYAIFKFKMYILAHIIKLLYKTGVLMTEDVFISFK